MTTHPTQQLLYHLDGSVCWKRYYLHGKLHREDGPAVIWYYEVYSVLVVEHEIYYQHGERHRVDGPAAIWYHPHGHVLREEYYHYGEKHRTKEPAAIYYRPDGSVMSEYYYLNGVLQNAT